MDRQIDENLLTSEVTNRPAIWDSLSDDYNNIVTRRNAWDEVVQIFSQPDDTPMTKLLLGRKLRSVWVRIRNRLMKVLRKQLLSDVDVLNRLSCFRQGDRFRNRLTRKALHYFINSVSRDLEQSEIQERESNAAPASTIQRPRGGFASLHEATNPLINDPLNDPVNVPSPRASPRAPPRAPPPFVRDDYRDHLNINQIIDNAIAAEEEEERGFWVNGRGEGFNNLERDYIRTNVRDYFNTNGTSRPGVTRSEATAAQQQLSNRTLQQLRTRYERLLEQLNQQQLERRPLTGRQVWNNLRQPYAPGGRQDMPYDPLQNLGRQPARNPITSPRTYPSPFVRRMQPYYIRPSNVIRVPPVRGVPPRPASDPIPNTSQSNETRNFTVISGNAPRDNNDQSTNEQSTN